MREGEKQMLFGMKLRVFTTDITVSLSGISSNQFAQLQAVWARCGATAVPGIPAENLEVEGAEPEHRMKAVLNTASTRWGEVHGSGATEEESFELLQHRLVSSVTRAALSEQRHTTLMLHAAGISSLENGRTLALVGPSGTGKSTASRMLGSVFSYVSDETVAVNPGTLEVEPFPKPISTVVDGTNVKAQLGPDELGLLAVSEASSLTLHRLVLLKRGSVEEIPQPFLESLNPVEALMEIVPQTSYLSKRHRSLTNLLEAMARTGGASRLNYSEAASLVDPVRLLLARDVEPASWDHFPAALDSDAVAGIRRQTVLDAVVCEDQLLILHEEEGTQQCQLVVLAGIAPVVWDVANGLSFSELVDAVIAEIGAPPGPPEDSRGAAETAVGAALDEMVSRGIIVWDKQNEQRQRSS